MDVLITKSCPIIRQFNDLVQIYSLELHDGLKPKLPSIVNKVEVAFLKATIQLIFNPCFFFLVSPVPGSLFINCGSDFSYVDNVTQIPWVPDDQYITTGVKAFVPLGLAWYPQYSELQTLRYFPPSAHLKDCYKLPVIPNNTYQIRATFFYGDYDNVSETALLPNFELAIDATIVGSNLVSDFAQFQYAEYWVLTQTNVMSLCLSRIPSSNTNPFITAISLVPIYPNINSTAYECLYGGLYYHTHFRWNFGASGLLR